MSSQQIEVYGDESYGVHAIVYAALATPSSARLAVEKRLASVKVEFDGRPQNDIHCSQLFNAEARQKGPWAHLDRDDVFRLVGRVVSEMHDLDTRRAVAYWDRISAGPNTTSPWTDISGGVMPSGDQSYLEADKTMGVLLAGAAFQGMAEAFGAENLVLIPDPDRDSVLKWDPEPRSLEEVRSGFWFHTETGPTQIAPVKADAKNKPPLLQAADCLAYVAQRSFYPPSENTARFKAIYDACSPTVFRFVG